jgi:monoamine oxidase
MSEDTDIVVIGAGAAGLSVARRLLAAGRRVIVLEARDRIGGRIHTLHLPDWPAPVEAGAEFIHGEPAEIRDLVRSKHLATESVEGEHFHWKEGRFQQLDFDRVWSQILGRLRNAAAEDLSFAEFLARHCSDLPADEAAQAVAYVEGFNAADSRLISSRWVLDSDAESGQASGAFRLAGGYDGLLDMLIAGADGSRLDVRLSTTVSAVRWARGQVEIRATSSATGTALEPIRVPRAIITLPLGVLRCAPGEPGTVKFIPDLAAKWEQARSLHFGSVIKLFLRFREPFWQQAGLTDLGFLHAPDEPVQTWWTTNPVPSVVLIGWVGGPNVARFSGMSETEILACALDSLSRIFSIDRPRLVRLLEASRVANWQNDPFSRGAYSYVGVGGNHATQALAAPVANTLFFAGEATHYELSGTVAGAIASGNRAADEVLAVSG